MDRHHGDVCAPAPLPAPAAPPLSLSQGLTPLSPVASGSRVAVSCRVSESSLASSLATTLLSGLWRVDQSIASNPLLHGCYPWNPGRLRTLLRSRTANMVMGRSPSERVAARHIHWRSS